MEPVVRAMLLMLIPRMVPSDVMVLHAVLHLVELLNHHASFSFEWCHDILCYNVQQLPIYYFNDAKVQKFWCNNNCLTFSIERISYNYFYLSFILSNNSQITFIPFFKPFSHISYLYLNLRLLTHFLHQK